MEISEAEVLVPTRKLMEIGMVEAKAAEAGMAEVDLSAMDAAVEALAMLERASLEQR